MLVVGNVLGCVFLYRGNILVLARVFSQVVFLRGRVMGLVEPGEYLLVFVFSARPGCSSSYHMDWFEQQFQLDPFSRCSLGLHRKINIQRLPNRSVHA